MLRKNHGYIESLIESLMPAVTAAGDAICTAHGCEHERDDLMSVGFVRLVEIAPRLHGIRSPRDYAFVSAKNAMRKYLRRCPRWKLSHDAEPAQCDDVEAVRYGGIAGVQGHAPCGTLGRIQRLSQCEIDSRVCELLEEVWVACRGHTDYEIVSRRMVGDTMEEVADDMDIDESVVCRRLTRVRRKFLARNPDFKATLRP